MVEMPSPPLSPPAAAGQHTAEKKHRRKKRRGGIGGQPIRKPPKPVHDDPRPLAEKRAAYRAATGAPDKKGQEKRRITTTIADRLPELWLDSYDGPLWRELVENEYLGLTEGTLQLQHIAPLSTYREQGRQPVMRHQPLLSQRAADRNGWRGAGPCPRPALSGRLPSTCSCSSTGKVAELESPGARSLPPAALLRVQPPHPPCAPVPRAQPSCRPRGFGLGSPAPSLYVHPCRPMHAHRAASVARCLPRPPPTHTHSHPPHTLPSLSQPCAPRQ